MPGRQEGGREEVNRGCTVSCHLLSPSGAEQVHSQNRDLLMADCNAAGTGNVNSVSPAPTEPRYGGPSTDGSPMIQHSPQGQNSSPTLSWHHHQAFHMLGTAPEKECQSVRQVGPVSCLLSSADHWDPSSVRSWV